MSNRAAKTELFDQFASVAGALASGRRAAEIRALSPGDGAATASGKTVN